jgi:superfamily II DNA/RNA helicase
MVRAMKGAGRFPDFHFLKPLIFSIHFFQSESVMTNHVSPQTISKMGFEQLSPMQNHACELIGQGRNIVLLSPTGSGKTVAYLLPLLPKLGDGKTLLVILPTRELAQQVESVFKRMGAKLSSLCLHGGRPLRRETELLAASQYDAVFSTPGRLVDHLSQHSFKPAAVSRLVIDEFDKCLDMGFRPQLSQILSELSQVSQTVLTSATTSPELETLSRDSKKFELIDYTSKAEAEIQCRVVQSESKDKLPALTLLLSNLLCSDTHHGNAATKVSDMTMERRQPQIIVFVAHRESADRLSESLQRAGIDNVCYHGGLDQSMRERNLFRFRAGCCQTMVATDIAARGIDIPNTTAVVHYHLPADIQTMVHRSGRTSRWQNRGEVFLILSPGENVPAFMVNTVGFRPVEVSSKPQEAVFRAVYIGRGRKAKLSKADIMGFLCKQGQLNFGDIGLIEIHDSCSYVALRASKADQALKRVSHAKIKKQNTLFEYLRS